MATRNTGKLLKEDQLTKLFKKIKAAKSSESIRSVVDMFLASKYVSVEDKRYLRDVQAKVNSPSQLAEFATLKLLKKYANDDIIIAKIRSSSNSAPSEAPRRNNGRIILETILNYPEDTAKYIPAELIEEYGLFLKFIPTRKYALKLLEQYDDTKSLQQNTLIFLEQGNREEMETRYAGKSWFNPPPYDYEDEDDSEADAEAEAEVEAELNAEADAEADVEGSEAEAEAEDVPPAWNERARPRESETERDPEYDEMFKKRIQREKEEIRRIEKRRLERQEENRLKEERHKLKEAEREKARLEERSKWQKTPSKKMPETDRIISQIFEERQRESDERSTPIISIKTKVITLLSQRITPDIEKIVRKIGKNELSKLNRPDVEEYIFNENKRNRNNIEQYFYLISLVRTYLTEILSLITPLPANELLALLQRWQLTFNKTILYDIEFSLGYLLLNITSPGTKFYPNPLPVSSQDEEVGVAPPPQVRPQVPPKQDIFYYIDKCIAQTRLQFVKKPDTQNKNPIDVCDYCKKHVFEDGNLQTIKLSASGEPEIVKFCNDVCLKSDTLLESDSDEN